MACFDCSMVNLIVGWDIFKCIDKVSEVVLSVCPNHKNIIDETPLYNRFVQAFSRASDSKGPMKRFELGGSHCCTLFL